MNTRPPLIATIALAASLISGAAQAALYDRGGGLIYDDVMDITWLQDASYARGSGYDWTTNDGRMTWSLAMAWADNLNYYDSVRNVVWNDWRLTKAPQPDSTCNSGGYYCTSSEMGHLFNVDLVSARNPGLFVNLQDWSGLYLSSDVHFDTDQNLGQGVWSFEFRGGAQRLYYNADSNFNWAWAVRDGDVAAVPEPETYAMMLAGLGLVGFVARRRKLANV